MSIDDVTDLTPRVRYVALAAQTVFAYPFPVFQAADIKVYVAEALTTGYTVDGVTDNLGGNITFLTPMVGGEIVTIYRDTVVERTTDVQQNGPIASSTFNDELDKLYTIAQELKAKIGRAIRFPFTAAQSDAQSELSPLSNWYNKFLYIGSTGLLEAAATVSGVVALTQSLIGSLLNPQTATEAALGIDPPNKWYTQGNLLRYQTNASPGVTDMSVGWANMLKVINSLAFTGTYTFGSAKGRVPAGDYKISTGYTAINLNCCVEGDGPQVTRINVGAGQKLTTVTGTVSHFKLSNLALSGGAGYWAHTNTGTNVQGHTTFEDIEVYDHTETAFGTLASDFPYLRFKRVFFYGSTALTSKGIVHSGNPDELVLEECSFLRNRYHLKLTRGNNAKIVDCDMLRFQDGGGAPVLVDVWLVPYNQAVNAGAGLEFLNTKFGNETLNVNDVRILIADEGAGTNAFDKVHSTSVSAGYVDGLAIRGGYIGGSSNMVRGLIYSYTPNVRNITIDSYWDGGRYPEVVEFAAGVPVPNDRTIDTWSIHLNQLSNPTEIPFGAVSNASVVNHGRDPMAMLFGNKNYQSHYVSAAPADFKSLWNQANDGATAFTLTSATKANITDSHSDADAAEITYSAANGSALGDVDTPDVDRLAWAQIEVMTGSSLALTQLDIRIDNSGGDILAKRVVKVPATWQRIYIPFIARSIASGVHMNIIPGDYSAGVKTKVKLGRPFVHHGTEPADPGLLYLTAKKVFDWPSINSLVWGAPTTVTVAGAALGDKAEASMSIDLAGITLFAYVSGVDTVTVRPFNSTGAPVDLASATLYATVNKRVKYA